MIGTKFKLFSFPIQQLRTIIIIVVVDLWCLNLKYILRFKRAFILQQTIYINYQRE